MTSLDRLHASTLTELLRPSWQLGFKRGDHPVEPGAHLSGVEPGRKWCAPARPLTSTTVTPWASMCCYGHHRPVRWIQCQARALRLFEELLPDQARVLSAAHPDTLHPRNNIAHWTAVIHSDTDR